jgi:hypothetical protein
MSFALLPGMECFFGSYLPLSHQDKNSKRLVCFSIPDAGIAFKAPFTGEELHTDYASLLTLLEFVEMNGKMFEGHNLKIYGDNIDLVNQVNQKKPCMFEFSELLRKALEYKKKYNFSLGWVPPENNPSTNLLFD